jgi:hypothetical protein
VEFEIMKHENSPYKLKRKHGSASGRPYTVNSKKLERTAFFMHYTTTQGQILQLAIALIKKKNLLIVINLL